MLAVSTTFPFAQSRPTPARDVPPGTFWAFRDHRTMAEIMAEEAKQKQAA